jgi:hypothetical protein
MGEYADGSERDGRLLMKTLNEQMIMLVECSLCYAAKYGKYVQHESTRLFDKY